MSEVEFNYGVRFGNERTTKRRTFHVARIHTLCALALVFVPKHKHEPAYKISSNSIYDRRWTVVECLLVFGTIKEGTRWILRRCYNPFEVSTTLHSATILLCKQNTNFEYCNNTYIVTSICLIARIAKILFKRIFLPPRISASGEWVERI